MIHLHPRTRSESIAKAPLGVTETTSAEMASFVVRLDPEKGIQISTNCSSKVDETKGEWFCFPQSPPGVKGDAESEDPTEDITPWNRFARTTTGHGFARMVDKQESCQLRIFWALAVILLTAGLFVSVSIISYESLVLKGLQREFIVQNNDTMLLPDIHICDTSLFNRTILQGKLIVFREILNSST